MGTSHTFIRDERKPRTRAGITFQNIPIGQWFYAEHPDSRGAGRHLFFRAFDRVVHPMSAGVYSGSTELFGDYEPLESVEIVVKG